jgi:dTDP-D-glucose 4,6-dehydratase
MTLEVDIDIKLKIIPGHTIKRSWSNEKNIRDAVYTTDEIRAALDELDKHTKKGTYFSISNHNSSTDIEPGIRVENIIQMVFIEDAS